jgi:SP family galactose:H+ symporter-like MFS transporter
MRFPVSRSTFIALVAAIAALGGLLFGYDTGVISGAILFIKRDFTLSTSSQELVVSVVLIGAMVGAFIAGGMTDWRGRRPTLVTAAVVFALGAIASAVATSVPLLIAARFVVGLAIGLSSVTAPLYLSEVAPRETRGALVSLYQFAVTIGILAAFLIDLGFSHGGNWRAMLGLAIVPAALLFFGMLAMPETPRWLFAHGQEERGRDILARSQQGTGLQEAERDIRATLAQAQGAHSRELLTPALRRPLAIGVGLAVLQQVTGINTVIYYGPQIFQLSGTSSDHASILATAIVGGVNVVMTILAIARIDQWGRKPLLYAGVAGMTLALCALALSFGIPGLHGVRGAIALGSLIVYVGCFAFSLGPITWLLISEVYPLRVRGRGMSVATLANWAANFVVSLVFLSMIDALGPTATFLVYAVLSIATIVFVAVVVPETKRRELETISAGEPLGATGRTASRSAR